MTTETEATTERRPRGGGQTEVLDKNLRTQMMFGLPVGLKIALEAHAKEIEKSTARIIVELLAEHLDYELPAARQVQRKYASEAERKEAQKAAQKEKRATMKALMEKYRKGEIQISE